MSSFREGVALLTDFGNNSLYTGQVNMVLRERSPRAASPVVDLISDLPRFRPDLAAYLIPALASCSSNKWLYICIVDPGVGGDRKSLVLQADGQWFIGPDNGLLSQISRQSVRSNWWTIKTPLTSSLTFHGRDVFAHEAAYILSHGVSTGEKVDDGEVVGRDWPADLAKIIYVDHYGNLMTGLRAETLKPNALFIVGEHRLIHATKFCDLPPGELFWYKNSLGLVEIAANKAKANELLGLVPGDAFNLQI
jgi:S-adenosylmethionine hydrolase